METIGKIEIRVTGKIGNVPLTPENFDIRYISEMISNVENLLFPGSKRDRPLVTYNIEEGSVNNAFRLPQQHVIGFQALMLKINEQNSIDFLERKSADSLEKIQRSALEKDFKYEIRTSLSEEPELVIDASTSFFRSKDIWADAEFYLYGEIKDAGGSNKVNIHLKTEDYGLLIIDTDEEMIRSIKENMLFKTYGARVQGRQNVKTGEMDEKSLKLIKLEDYAPTYNAQYLDKLIERASKNWEDVDAESWLAEIRGYEV